MTRIYYYSTSTENPIVDFLNSQDENEQTKIARIFTHIKNHGLIQPIPNVRKLSGTSLWEIRILGKSNVRLIYAVEYKGHVLILHGFVKKKNKTPLKDLHLALKRYGFWRQKYPSS